MDSININRPVTIKVKVTEDYKRKVALELQENLQKIDSELQYLEFHSKRMISELEKQNPQGIPAAMQHLDSQKRNRLEAKNKLLERIKEVAKLPIGSAIVHSSIESTTAVKVGDNWSDILGAEILVQDEIIIEIKGKI